jgi:Tol biopolymer transport system component
MSPEQAKGAKTDHRSDVFSFGCVLYEMLTGRLAFHGETISDILASVLAREPDFTRLPPDLNPRLCDLLRRCLEKPPRRRWQAVGDLRMELEVIAPEPYRKPDVARTAAPQAPSRKALAWVLRAATALLFVALAIPAFLYFSGAESGPDVRFLVAVPDMPNPLLTTISPDGRKVAFVAAGEGGAPQLFVRPLDSVTAEPLAGTEGATNPFWSPDSRFIAFTSGSTFNSGTLKKIEATGGAPQTIASLESSIPSRVTSFGAGTWNDEGVIVFSNRGRLHRVSAAGGVPVVISTLDESLEEAVHNWPHFLPDGRHYLYLAWSNRPEHRAIYVSELDAPGRQRLAASESMAVFSMPGYLIFQRQGALFAQAFDATDLTLQGEPIRVAEDVAFAPVNGQAAFAASRNGVLTYRGGGASGNVLQFVWFDRSGKRLGEAGRPDLYGTEFDLSPDGRQIAAAVRDPATSRRAIWIIDWIRDVRTRVTSASSAGVFGGPVWSHDGLRVAFNRQTDQSDVMERATTGLGDETVVVGGPDGDIVEEWSKDGRYMVIAHLPASESPSTSWQALPLFGDRKPFPIHTSASFDFDEPEFSFDGKWLAYNSDESGTTQVYLMSFPAADQKRQLSIDGGAQPQWRQDGRELYYVDLDGNLMAVDIAASSRIDSGRPRALFKTGLSVLSYARQYAATSDGRRFLIQLPVAETTPTPITVVVNWTAAIGR